MAVALRMHDLDVRIAVPRLRALPGARNRRAGSKPACRSRRSVAACRRTFGVACVALVVVATLGMVRVGLTVKATEAAVLVGSLAADIQAERVVIEQLEADKNALAAPTRIQNIAETTMRMGVAAEIDYMALATQGSAASDNERVVAEASAVKDDRVARILTGIMHMTAGEAQVLLVGDAGLISSR